MEAYRCCSRCVMDTSDPEISFDAAGVCNHCRDFDDRAQRMWFPNDEGRRRWDELVARLKADGEGADYDCILGLSGGLDSSYLALKVHEAGLRPLVMHVDAGWNTELAVANIEALVKYCGFDLHTHVVDWEEMRDLQLAYFHAAVANQDVPQDHIFFASLYHFSVANGTRYILSGGNMATEGIFPDSWHGNAMDSVNLKAIQKKYGSRKLVNYKTISFFDFYIWYPFVKKMRTLRPLDYLVYVKTEALKELQAKVGYKPYPRKHGESVFTRLFQDYYLPRKFGIDKRRAHFSSLIASGQLERQEALRQLDEPLYSPEELEADIHYLCKKLRISRGKFDELMELPVRNYNEFRNWDFRYKALKCAQVWVQKVLRRDIRVH
jgi:N-acetyl sugar amidotransferase